MKKFFLILVAVTCFFFSANTVAITAMPLSAQEQPAAVHNHFETSFEGWTEWGDFNRLEARRDAAYNSSRGMRVANRRTPTEGAASEKGFYIEGGSEYEYGMFVRHSGSAPETFNLTLQWIAPGSGERGMRGARGNEVIATQIVQPNQWTKLTTKYTAAQNARNFTVIITTNSTNDFDFDEFTVVATNPNAKIEQPSDDVGLKDVYARYFRVGNILNGNVVQNAAVRNLYLREYNSVTAENEHKPMHTKSRGRSTNTNIAARFSTGAAAINDFCERNNIPLRLHTLTWHGQTPDWFFIQNIDDSTNYRNTQVPDVPWATPAVMNQRLESFVRNKFALFAERYPNLNIFAMDVVNEYVRVERNSGGPRLPGFDGEGAGGQQGSRPGNSPWTAIYHGVDAIPSQMSWEGSFADTNNWLWRAFHYARQYAPDHTKIFYNDYNEWDPAKTDYIINNILIPLKERGLVDGMGMQGHVNSDPSETAWSSFPRFRTAMDRYANVGNAQTGYLQVHITELDVSTNRGNFTFEQQAEKYRQIFEHAVAVNARGQGQITSICMWGPNDANTWLGAANTPMLHDAQNQKKPAYDKVFGIVPQSNWGDGNNPTFGK